MMTYSSRITAKQEPPFSRQGIKIFIMDKQLRSLLFNERGSVDWWRWCEETFLNIDVSIMMVVSVTLSHGEGEPLFVIANLTILCILHGVASC